MSMLTDSFEPFVMIDRTTQPDGYGGFMPAYKEGAAFSAAAAFDTSVEARVAAVQGVTNLYTILTTRAVTLDYHDIIRRESDGKIFRITSDGHDNKTPPGAALDLRQVTAEEWRLSDDITQ